MSEPEIFLDAASASKEVGVSVSGLRRLAPIYESVFGLLPRSGKGSGDSPRLWPNKAVERLRVARALVEANKHRSVKTALEALEGLTPSDSPEEGLEAILGPSQLTDRQVLELLVNEVRTLQAQVQELKQLPAPPEKLKSAAPSNEPGLIVRVATRLEGFLKRFR